MGWIFSLICMIGFLFNKNVLVLIAASIFALAGTISLKNFK